MRWPLSQLLRRSRFREYCPGQYALKVGFAVKKKSKKIGDLLWLDERVQPSTRYNNTVRENNAIRKQMGLYYSTTTDSSRNTYVKNARVIKGEGLFGSLSDSGIISPFSLNIKALLRFVLLYCGYATEYKTFVNKGRDDGLLSLVRVLKTFARHATTAEEGVVSTQEDGNGAPNGSDKEGELFATDDSDEASVKRDDSKRKQTMDAEVDEGAPAKKTRVC
ncbi:hypothetical protein J4E90_004565 [Alternaria incomplexa]|uniref:uncharacterized protein n=1 Tax=Alternaria incomplexa TaxID=1187928 RepID=UPI002220E875|nr:uncharacterized protein J4E90_004565 [Alternaria incomplexa]KAI4916119.1 hypothetical protein J4E90_004565 [Alternaria incomplexa]